MDIDIGKVLPRIVLVIIWELSIIIKAGKWLKKTQLLILVTFLSNIESGQVFCNGTPSLHVFFDNLVLIDIRNRLWNECMNRVKENEKEMIKQYKIFLIKESHSLFLFYIL